MPWNVKVNNNVSAMQKDVIFRHVQEVFELDIKPEAVTNSPVKTGTNRRSIDATTEFAANDGVLAKLFTQSGYGGFLEIGTRFLQARPYLYPAYERFKKKLSDVKQRFDNL